jgi:hypothetical protein
LIHPLKKFVLQIKKILKMKKRTRKQGYLFGGKIKTEHTIIAGLHQKLQTLSKIPEIKSIIPGRIKSKGSSRDQVSIRLTIPTSSGLKAIGKSQGASQELFIVTDHPQAVAAIMNQQAHD